MYFSIEASALSIKIEVLDSYSGLFIINVYIAPIIIEVLLPFLVPFLPYFYFIIGIFN